MRKRCNNFRGFSLIECLLLTMILGIVGVAAGTMIFALAKTPRDTDRQFQFDTALVSKMEFCRSLPYDQLIVGTSLSDNVYLDGKTYSRTVSIELADGNGDGTAEARLKRITVTLQGQNVSTLVNQP